MTVRVSPAEYASFAWALAMMWEPEAEHPTPWLRTLRGRRYGATNTEGFIRVCQSIGRQLGWM